MQLKRSDFEIFRFCKLAIFAHSFTIPIEKLFNCTTLELLHYELFLKTKYLQDSNQLFTLNVSNYTFFNFVQRFKFKIVYFKTENLQL